MTTIQKLAVEIYDGAKDAGASREQLTSYDLTRDDCAYIRREYLGSSHASELSDTELRQVILAVEAEVRGIAACAGAWQ